MNELYWITRLDKLCVCLEVFLLIFFILSVVHIIMYYMLGRRDYNSEQEYEKAHKNHKNHFILCVSLFIIIFICQVFTPTTKEALIIYGVGGTIDYVKSNKIVKELPDKCIKAADKFLNDYIGE